MTRGLAALFLLIPLSASADEIRDLRVKRSADLTSIATFGALWIGSELDKERFSPDRCKWCEPPGIDASARRAFKWDDTHRAALASDVLDFAGMPVFALGGITLLAAQHDVAGKNAPDDAIIIVQAAVAASALNQLVKFTVARERPFVHHGGTDEHTDDYNLSFYSGHTSLAFSLVAATATVAQMRGYKNAWVIWPTGIVLATTVGWLRMAADKHWLTDVATGAALGTATGILVPMALHAPRRETTGTVTFESRRAPMLMATFVF